MGLRKRRQVKTEPDIAIDFSFISETYGYTPASELEPGQEIAIHQGLGVTALRGAKFNRDHLQLAELLGRDIDHRSNTKAV